VGRRKHGCCEFCEDPFALDPYNHAKQTNCLKPKCRRAANAQRQRRYRQKLRADPKALAVHRMNEAARAKYNRLKNKQIAENATADKPPPWLDTTAGLQAAFLGLLAQLTDSKTMPDLLDTAGALAMRGIMLAGSETTVFRAGG